MSVKWRMSLTPPVACSDCFEWVFHVVLYSIAFLYAVMVQLPMLGKRELIFAFLLHYSIFPGSSINYLVNVQDDLR